MSLRLQRFNSAAEDTWIKCNDKWVMDQSNSKSELWKGDISPEVRTRRRFKRYIRCLSHRKWLLVISSSWWETNTVLTCGDGSAWTIQTSWASRPTPVCTVFLSASTSGASENETLLSGKFSRRNARNFFLKATFSQRRNPELRKNEIQYRLTQNVNADIFYIRLADSIVCRTLIYTGGVSIGMLYCQGEAGNWTLPAGQDVVLPGPGYRRDGIPGCPAFHLHGVTLEHVERGRVGHEVDPRLDWNAQHSKALTPSNETTKIQFRIGRVSHKHVRFGTSKIFGKDGSNREDIGLPNRTD